MDRSRCVVLVPYRDHIEPSCDESLRALEARGYTVRRVDASAAIDRARSELATQALADGFEELMWIDSDIAFDPDAVDRLRRHGLPIVAGLFAKRGLRQFGCFFLDETQEIALGEGGGPLEVRYIGTAFLLTHRRVYDEIRRGFSLPLCNAKVVPVVPYFLPMVIPQPEGGFWYLSEAWSFCERARQTGHKIMVDSSIRLLHLGRYGYGWEDVGAPIARTKSATLKLPKRGG